MHYKCFQKIRTKLKSAIDFSFGLKLKSTRNKTDVGEQYGVANFLVMTKFPENWK